MFVQSLFESFAVAVFKGTKKCKTPCYLLPGDYPFKKRRYGENINYSFTTFKKTKKKVKKIIFCGVFFSTFVLNTFTKKNVYIHKRGNTKIHK